MSDERKDRLSRSAACRDLRLAAPNIGRPHIRWSSTLRVRMQFSVRVTASIDVVRALAHSASNVQYPVYLPSLLQTASETRHYHLKSLHTKCLNHPCPSRSTWLLLCRQSRRTFQPVRYEDSSRKDCTHASTVDRWRCYWSTRVIRRKPEGSLRDSWL